MKNENATNNRAGHGTVVKPTLSNTTSRVFGNKMFKPLVSFLTALILPLKNAILFGHMIVKPNVAAKNLQPQYLLRPGWLVT